MAILLPLLTSLIRSIQIPQMHDAFATEISLLPLRPYGVQHVIEFIASSLVPASAIKDNQEDLVNQVQDIPMSLETMQQASKLLASVPKSLDSGRYFEKIAPQLLALLDGTSGQTMSTAAAYIIGTGILGKRSTGAPGSVGWKLFAVPLIETINPSPDGPTDGLLAAQTVKQTSVGRTIVSGVELDLALQRLSKIVLFHPNPGVAKRLLRSLLLPLWGIAGYSTGTSTTASAAWKILETYIRLYANPEQIQEITKNILFDGPGGWVFAPCGGDLVEIRKRTESEHEGTTLLKKMKEIDHRVSLAVELLSKCNMQSNILCTVFSSAVKDWLSSKGSLHSASTGHLKTSTDILVRSITNMKFVMEMITTFESQLTSQSLEIVRIVDWLLADVVEMFRDDARHDNMARANPSLIELAQIAPSAFNATIGDSSRDLYSESFAIAALAISLLGTVIQASDVGFDLEGKDRLESINNSLGKLNRHKGKLPASLIAAASAIESEIHTFLQTGGQKQQSSKQQKALSQRRPQVLSNGTGKHHEMYAEALENSSSPQPPVRIEAFSKLSELISVSSPVVDVPALTVLFLTILSEDDPSGTTAQANHSISEEEPDETDDYVILGALRTLTQLALYEPQIVIPLLLEAYLDQSNSRGLDVRLRVAQSFVSIVDTFSSHTLPDSPAAIHHQLILRIAEAALTISSRRGRLSLQDTNKPPEFKASQQPAIPPGTGFPATEDEVLEHILSTWRLTPNNEEDLRLRASALGLLAHILATSTPSLHSESSTLLTSIVDTAYAVLRLESGPGKAIARRAAATVFLESVRALERVWEAGGETALMKIGDGNVDAMVERMRVIVGNLGREDEDELVRGHIGVVGEELEAWRMSRMVGIVERAGPEGTGMTEELGLKGLRGLDVDVSGEHEQKVGRKLVEEIDD